MDDHNDLNPVQRALRTVLNTAYLYVYGFVVHPVQAASILKDSAVEQAHRFEERIERRRYWRALHRKRAH